MAGSPGALGSARRSPWRKGPEGGPWEDGPLGWSLRPLSTRSPQLIYMHWMNTVVNYCGPFEYEVGYCEKLKHFLEANLEWMQREMQWDQDSGYWHQVGLPGSAFRGQPSCLPSL